MLRKPQSSPVNLILITNHFPFGLAEAFLENEISFLENTFERVIIVARDIHSPQLRQNRQKSICYRLSTKSNFSELLALPFWALKKIRKTLKYAGEEIKAIKKERPLSFPLLIKLLQDLGKAVVTAHHLEGIIAQQNLRGRVIFYSYWLNNNALASTLVRAPGCDLRAVSRAHGVDVYEFRSPLNYLSYRNTLARTLHRIYCISENGSEHLRAKINPALHGKIAVSRLGTLYAGEAAQRTDAETFHIVSCSFLLPVKQVHLIIEALCMIENRNITWTHIGDGELRSMLEGLAKNKLAGKINYTFKGSLPNTELMQFYRDHYVHLFINTSISEGLPVTMMEAQSFGIPIVAPAVGGITEIVSAENGVLFPAGSSGKQIAEAIDQVLRMDHSAYQALRANAFRSWDRKYNAERNFPTFVSEILSL